MNRMHEVLLAKKNVVSVGRGRSTIGGVRCDDICVVVGVEKKVPLLSLKAKDRVSEMVDLDGILTMTDVVEVGKLRAFGHSRDRNRPARPGSSIGHFDITAGTFGCLVKRDGKSVLLSNNHIFANQNRAELGDSIWQPGPIDRGTENDEIAVLLDFIPLNFGVSDPDCRIARWVARLANALAKRLGSSHRLRVEKSQPTTNLVDAAIAEPLDGVTDSIIDIGSPTGLVDPELDMQVRKFGRTTHLTEGEITQVGATVRVGYGDNKVATFTNQFLTGPMSAGGDSGSAILTKSGKNLVGLLFAGSDSVTIASPMRTVFELLNLTV